MSVIKEEYLQKEITVHDLLPLSFLKKSPYTGSKDSLRYRIEKKEEENGGEIRKSLLVTTWYTPFAFDMTPDEEKTWKEFPFREEALPGIAEYLEGLRKEGGAK